MFWPPLASPWGCDCVPTGSCQSGLPRYWGLSPWRPPHTADQPPVYSRQTPPLEGGTAYCPEMPQRNTESGEIFYIYIFTFYNISPYRYFNNYIHSELLCILTIWVLNFDLFCYRATNKGPIEIVKILQQLAVMALKSATWHAKENPHPPSFRVGCK